MKWLKGFGNYYYNELDERKIYLCDDGGCCISWGSWMPGVYEDFRTAEWAFDFDDRVLYDLQQSINPNGIITMEMLNETRRN